MASVDRRGRGVILICGIALVIAAGVAATLHSGQRASGPFASPCRDHVVFGGPTGIFGPSGGFPETAPWDVRLNRNGRTLKSVDVTLAPRLGKRNIEVDVLHRASLCSTTFSVVYRSRFLSADPPSSWVGPTKGVGPVLALAHEIHPTPPLPAFSVWSGGRLYPRDWVGGCQSGLFTVYVITLARANYGYGSDDFTCSP